MSMYSNKQLTALAEVSRSVAYNYMNENTEPKRFEREVHLKIASIVLLQQEAKRHTWHDLFADIMSHGLQNSHSVAFADVMKVSKDDAYHLLYNLTDIFERVGWVDVSGIQIEDGLSWFRVNDMPFAYHSYATDIGTFGLMGELSNDEIVDFIKSFK